MSQICIPIPQQDGSDKEKIQIEVRLGDQTCSYQLVNYSFADSGSETKEDVNALHVEGLKEAISAYGKDWQIIQILQPSSEAEYVQLLFRKL